MRVCNPSPPPPPPGPAAGGAIIGTSRDGRLRFTPGQRVELLTAFDRGGQSAMAFARGHGINYRPRHRPRPGQSAETAAQKAGNCR